LIIPQKSRKGKRNIKRLMRQNSQKSMEMKVVGAEKIEKKKERRKRYWLNMMIILIWTR
jgi:hypothetical protein